MPCSCERNESRDGSYDRKTPVIHSQSIIGAKPICIIEWLVFNDSQEFAFARDEKKISYRRVL